MKDYTYFIKILFIRYSIRQNINTGIPNPNTHWEKLKGHCQAILNSFYPCELVLQLGNNGCKHLINNKYKSYGRWLTGDWVGLYGDLGKLLAKLYKLLLSFNKFPSNIVCWNFNRDVANALFGGWTFT